GKRALPRLHGPVRAVGGPAGPDSRDQPVQRGPGIGTASLAEGLPVVAMVFAVPARVVELELDLRARLSRRKSVHCAPRENVLELPGGRVGEHRFAPGVDGELNALGIAVDELRRTRGGRKDG